VTVYSLNDLGLILEEAGIFSSLPHPE